jgi:hypothetical protein
MSASPAAAGRLAKLLVQAHACCDCRELSARPFDKADREPGVEYRPDKPRPIRAADASKGPRAAKRCDTHGRAYDRAQRAEAAAKRSRKRAGVDEETRQAVKALQGDRCPCGAPLLPRSGRRLEPNADHDHDLAALHDHPEEVACPECFRGFLCHHCNREVIGYLTNRWGRPTSEVAAALRNLADYLEDPPMRRLRRERPDLFPIEETAA